MLFNLGNGALGGNLKVRETVRDASRMLPRHVNRVLKIIVGLAWTRAA